MAIDCTMLEPAQTGLENVLVMVDIFSKYTLAVHTSDQRSSTVAQVLAAEWFSILFLPRYIQTRATISRALLSSSLVVFMELRILA